MKYSLCLLLSILALSTSAHAYEPKIEIIEQFDNLRMVAFINKDDVSSNPEWNPGNTPPPLTIEEAIKAVKNLNKQSKKIKEIELRLVPKYDNKWHYLIKVSNLEMKSKYDIYVVLMNGKVIPAIIEPQGYK